jgi:two-component system sensor histidine kinase SenX3
LLRALVDEAWTDGEPLTRRVHLTDLAPIEQAEVRATRVADRYVLITLADLTEMGRVEAIRHDFVSNIGHELRTPITAVDLIASTLEVAADDPEAVRHFAGRLTAEARRMGRLTEDVLALAKAQDRDAAHFEAVDLADAVDQAVERQRTASESKSITLSVTHRARPTVWGDSQALVTAVENLISNAINYSPSGSKVAVALTLDRPGAQAVTTVADNGIGIEPSDQERIFERFYRADQARSRRTGGTGLGLAIVKNTMAGHRGAVSVASKPGAGATFTLRLPLYQSKEHLA